MIDRRYDFIILSFEKFLSQLVTETPMIRQSFRHNHKNSVASSKNDFAYHCKTSNAVALRSYMVLLLRSSLLYLSISTANSVLSPSLKVKTIKYFNISTILHHPKSDYTNYCGVLTAETEKINRQL